MFGYAREGQLRLLEQAAQAEGSKWNVNAVDEDGRTLLHWAASCGQREVVDWLLGRGARVDVKDEGDWTPLLSAAAAGKLDVVRSLHKAGATLTEGGGALRATPLHYACSKGHAELVAFLLEQGASPKGSDRYGNTALHKAVRWARVVGLLLEAGAAVSAKNKVGQTPLHIAAEEGAEESCILLLKAGALADSVDDEGNTPVKLGGKQLEHIWKKQ